MTEIETEAERLRAQARRALGLARAASFSIERSPSVLAIGRTPLTIIYSRPIHEVAHFAQLAIRRAKG